MDPDFALTPDNAPAIAAICAHLDGLPLAIELAVARIKVLTPQQMLPRLLHRFEFLTEGLQDAPDRHRTLRAMIYGDPIRAARLAGFVAAMSNSVGASPIPIANYAFQEGLSAARRALSTETFDQVWADGQAMSIDEAIDEALAVEASDPSRPQT